VLQLREQAELAVTRLRSLDIPSWTGVADAMAGNLELLDGKRGTASDLFERASAGFIEAHMSALAACARRRRGEIVGGELGNRWVSEADVDLQHLGVHSPERFARTYFAPFSILELEATAQVSDLSGPK
jgi:hypothetical protein